MSINSFEIDGRKQGDNFGQNYNSLAQMYRHAIQEHHYKRAKEIESDMKRTDVELAKQGEQ
jgi:hypothetical protein